MPELPNDDPDRPSLYEEICRFYIGQIADGIICPGELLPPARHVAEKQGTSASTARHALRLLAEIGWADPVAGCRYMALRPARM